MSPAGAPSEVLSWGNGSLGTLGNGTTTDVQTIPVPVLLPAGVTPTAIAGSSDGAYAIGSDGNLYAWGYGGAGELGNGTTTMTQTTPVLVSLPAGVAPTAIAAATYTAYAIGSDGNLYAWGLGSFGNLGNGTMTYIQTTPVRVLLPAGVAPTAIAGATYTGYAIGSDDNLYAWGYGAEGELGNGTMNDSTTTPIRVSLPAGVAPVAIAGRSDGGYAIGSDGNLYAWGIGINGELGNGTTTVTQTTPVLVSLPAGVAPTAIAASTLTGYAIGSDGRLYAWGWGGDGELGDGTTTATQTTPVPVLLPAGVAPIAIAASSGTGYAIGSDGNLYVWGYGGGGQLGNGTTTYNQTTPVTVLLPAGVVPTGLGTDFNSTTGYVLVASADDLSLGQPADITVDATGPNGAVVTYPLPTVSDPDLATLPTPSCAPASGSIFAIGTTTVQCTVTDVYRNTATTSFSVTVLGVPEQLVNLQKHVMKIKPEQAKSLSDMVRVATTLWATGQVQAACLRLNLFIRQVERFASAGAIPPHTADQLIAMAKQIEAVIGC